MYQERGEFTLYQEQNLQKLSDILRGEPCILSARVYGSFLYSAQSTDVDLAVMAPSSCGVIAKDIYERLYRIRNHLCKTLNLDIDLVPHTFDEVEETGSPLWNPRYHPSLSFGIDVKERFPLPLEISPTQNVSMYVLLDNRTVTRRQILRPSGPENWRIFLAKLIHGPGNALTLISLTKGKQYMANPSDVQEAFKIFDQIYSTDSKVVLKQFNDAEKLIQEGVFSLREAVWLLNWYEALVATVLGYNTNILLDYLREQTATTKPIQTAA